MRHEPGSFTLWLGFGAMCLGMFMAVLDIQVVASSLTAIGAALDIAPDRLGWIQTAYLMAEVVAIPLTGILTRAFSLRWMFVAATLGFTAASLGCALSNGVVLLILLRVIQGFFGGMLIPAVFTAIFVIIPHKHEVAATTMAGIFALLAPTIGPLVGGWLTQTHSWHWIFLINIVPGLLVALTVALAVRGAAPVPALLRRLDILTLLLFAGFLATLEWLLNEGPRYHWRGVAVFAAIAAILVTCAWGVGRALVVAHPFVLLGRFRKRSFSLGCGLSFILGFGLYGSVYILALFLGLVRGHTPLAIGEILIVSGAAQLLTAPLAAWAETRLDARLLIAFGFGLFGLGLFASGFSTEASDFWPLFWPQVMRGAAMMFCLLPATRLALEHWPAEEVAEASGLFNLMRNLGGAIAIALTDTIAAERTPLHVQALVGRLKAGDPLAARLVGLPVGLFRHHAMAPVDPITQALIAPMVRRAALTQSFNEAWILLGALFLLALALLPAMRRAGPAPLKD